MTLAVALAGAACHGTSAAEDISVSWSLASPPLVGMPMMAEVTLHNWQGELVRGAHLSIQAFMSHPGMAPVVAEATERDDGVYEVPFQFTMAGDWSVLVTGTLPDGREVNHRVDIANVGRAR